MITNSYAMNLNEEQLKSVEMLAYRLFTPSMVAIAVGVDELDFVADVRIPGTPARIAFYKGYLQQQVETREAIIKAARNGSNPAQIELLKFFKQMNQAIEYE